jgi:hypothetical protein
VRLILAPKCCPRQNTPDSELWTPAGVPVCTACPAGKFSIIAAGPSGAASVCKQCAAGSFQAAEASIGCDACVQPSAVHTLRGLPVACLRPGETETGEAEAVAATAAPAPAADTAAGAAGGAGAGADVVRDFFCPPLFMPNRVRASAGAPAARPAAARPPSCTRPAAPGRSSDPPSAAPLTLLPPLH